MIELEHLDDVDPQAYCKIQACLVRQILLKVTRYDSLKKWVASIPLVGCPEDAIDKFADQLIDQNRQAQ